MKAKAITSLVLLLGLLVIACGCAIETTDPVQSDINVSPGLDIKERRQALQDFMDKNPCGVLRIGKPLFNVTGKMNAKTINGSKVYLLTPKNTSFQAAMYAAENCRPWARFDIGEDGRFDLGRVSAGKYVVMVPAHRFSGAQGFPIVEEFNRSGQALEIVFHGGNHRHSVVAFHIE